ncbi:hypothetical protein T190115A13A_230032 [Tenacibaculum sp. 190524A02b]|uniref:Uncharacterized protein n=1 Tax=Tenacibaculum vairaonense TaxID=3137860 RepID=A0ABM9PLD5_9FLAO
MYLEILESNLFNLSNINKQNNPKIVNSAKAKNFKIPIKNIYLIYKHFLT